MRYQKIVGLLLCLSHLGAYAQTRPESFPSLQNELIRQVNEYRYEKQLEPLELHVGLQKSAQHHCAYITKKNKLSHDETPIQWRTVKDRIDYFSPKIFNNYGENIVLMYASFSETTPKAVAKEMIDLWKDSPTHNELLLHTDLQFANFGITYNPKTRAVFCVMNFGGK